MDFPCWWQGTNHVSCHHCLPRCTLAGSWNWGQNSNLVSVMCGVGISRDIFAHQSINSRFFFFCIVKISPEYYFLGINLQFIPFHEKSFGKTCSPTCPVLSSEELKLRFLCALLSAVIKKLVASSLSISEFLFGSLLSSCFLSLTVHSTELMCVDVYFILCALLAFLQVLEGEVLLNYWVSISHHFWITLS